MGQERGPPTEAFGPTASPVTGNGVVYSRAARQHSRTPAEGGPGAWQQQIAAAAQQPNRSRHAHMMQQHMFQSAIRTFCDSFFVQALQIRPCCCR